MHKQVIAVTCFPPSFKGKGSAVAEGVGCSQAAWEQLLHSGTSRSLDLEYQNKKKTQSQLSEQIKDRCVPPLRGWVWALPQPSSVGWWCTREGFRTPVPAAGPSQQLGIVPTPSLLLSHQHSSCPLPSAVHILPYTCTTSLSHSPSSYTKKELFTSFLQVSIPPLLWLKWRDGVVVCGKQRL